jgi:hypothetical protein
VYPFVREIANTNKFEVPEETKQFIRSIVGPIGIISMAGAARLGKSFFLNRVLLKRKQGFETGDTVNACTKGIWLWGEVIPGMFGG